MSAPPCSRCGAEYPLDSSPAGLCPACLLATALSEDPDAADSLDDSHTPLPAGTEVGAFRILGLLGKGGMGAVYKAFDAGLERTIALKVLPPEFAHSEAFARRFEREARVVARLEHPHIVPIYATGIDAGVPWMSTRLMTGGNLCALLASRRLGALEAVRMLRHVADALDYAHARGVVHRDIKPSNILLDDSHRACVADFGLAQIIEADDRMTRTGALVGTPHYMSPERALGDPVDHRCDIYSLGIVAYEMFTGAVPFADDSPVAVLLKHVSQPLPSPRDRSLPKALVDAIHRATAKDPAQRWSSAGTFATALEVALGAPPGSEVGTTEPSRRGAAGLRLGWAGVAAAALAAAIGLTWWIAWSPMGTEPPTEPIAIQQPANVEQSVEVAQSVGAVTTGATTRPGATPTAPAVRQPISPSSISAPSSQPPSAQPSPMPVDPPVSAAPARNVPTAETVAGDLVISPQPPAEPPPTPAPPQNGNGLAVARDEVVTPPQRLRAVSPDYPAAARAAQLEGDVVLEAVVGTDGRLRDVTVLQSAHPLLDDAAKAAVLKYEYAPALRNGTPEPARIRIAVSFRLQ